MDDIDQKDPQISSGRVPDVEMECSDKLSNHKTKEPISSRVQTGQTVNEIDLKGDKKKVKRVQSNLGANAKLTKGKTISHVDMENTIE